MSKAKATRLNRILKAIVGECIERSRKGIMQDHDAIEFKGVLKCFHFAGCAGEGGGEKEVRRYKDRKFLFLDRGKFSFSFYCKTVNPIDEEQH